MHQFLENALQCIPYSSKFSKIGVLYVGGTPSYLCLKNMDQNHKFLHFLQVLYVLAFKFKLDTTCSMDDTPTTENCAIGYYSKDYQV